MPHDFINAIENDPLKNIKIDGIILAADLVTKRRYNEAKRVLAKVLKACPNDAGMMRQLRCTRMRSRIFPKKINMI